MIYDRGRVLPVCSIMVSIADVFKETECYYWGTAWNGCYSVV